MAKNSEQIMGLEAVEEVSFIVAVFDDVEAAKEAYKSLKELKREGVFDIIAAAYMNKTDRSKIKIQEYKDWSGGKGAAVGGGVGALVGLIGGAVLLPLGVGALIGGVFAKVHDTRLDNKELSKAAEALPAGTSALIAIVTDEYVEAVQTELVQQGGKKVHSGEIPKSAYPASPEKTS